MRIEDENQPLQGTPLNIDKLVVIELVSGRISLKNYPTAIHLGQLESNEARRLEDYELHRVDLRQAKDAMQLLGNLIQGSDGIGHLWNTDSLQNILWAGVATAYCRCFDSARPFPLDPQAIFGPHPNALECHQLIWALRNKHFAHDVNEARDAIVGVALDVEGRNLDIVRSVNVGVFDFAHFQNTFNLVEAALAHVNQQRGQLVANLAQQIENLTVQERFALPAPEVRVPKDFQRARRSRRPKSAS